MKGWGDAGSLPLEGNEPKILNMLIDTINSFLILFAMLTL